MKDGLSPIVRLLMAVLCVAILCLPVTAGTPHVGTSAQDAVQVTYLPIVMRNYADILRLDLYALGPPHPRVTSGQYFTVLYHITNGTAQTQTVYLIARARDPLGVLTLLETSVGSGIYAEAAEVAPGSGWYAHTVVAPLYAPAGSYGLVWIVSATPLWADQVASAYEPNAFELLSAYP